MQPSTKRPRSLFQPVMRRPIKQVRGIITPPSPPATVAAYSGAGADELSELCRGHQAATPDRIEGGCGLCSNRLCERALLFLQAALNATAVSSERVDFQAPVRQGEVRPVSGGARQSLF